MKYPHWQYYMSILRDLEVFSRYVEISPDNYATYGVELTRLLLSAGSEIDVVAKLLCKEVNSGIFADSINDYQQILMQRFPHLPEIEVSLPKYLISLKPWSDWIDNKTPKWWNCYNKVKHQRSDHFREANLENTLLATSGLCILVCYLYHENLSSLTGITPLFMFLDRKYMTGGVSVLTRTGYVLPDF